MTTPISLKWEFTKVSIRAIDSFVFMFMYVKCRIQMTFIIIIIILATQYVVANHNTNDIFSS